MRTVSSSLVLLAALATPARATTYEVIDLGKFFVAKGVNNLGVVVGNYTIYGYDKPMAAIWSANVGITNLGTPGGTRSEGYAINDAGLVVGQGATAEGNYRAFLYTPGATDGVASNPQMKVLPGTGGSGYALNAVGVNQSGVVGGTIVVPPGGYEHLATWTNNGDKVTDEGSLPNGALAAGINNLGQVAGWSGTGDPSYTHLVLSTGGGHVLDLGTPGEGSVSATGVNDAGLVVGYWGLYYGGILAGPSTPVHFIITGPSIASATAINNRGDITGYYYDPQPVPVLIQRGTTHVNPNTLLPSGSGWDLQVPTGINDCGFIVGNGTIAGDSAPHAYLFKPVGVDACTNAFTVNSVGDLPQKDLTDEICNTGMTVMIGGQPVPECTMRAALQLSAAISGPNSIEFAIPGSTDHVIAPLTALPQVSDTTNIKGNTQAAGKIVLSGGGKAFEGLTITSSGSTVRGLVIVGFGGNGIGVSLGSGNTIAGNLIGVQAGGTTAGGNSAYGVEVRNGASGTIIGGTTDADRNVISGNLKGGVHIAGAIGGTIEGNYIGTNAAGTAALGNGIQNGSGILLDGAASNNTIGGAGHGAGACNQSCNLISGNYNVGITVGGTSADNHVYGNFIGAAIGGTTGLPNLGYGMNITATPGRTTVGGVGLGQGNLIAFNQLTGVRVGGADALSSKGNAIRGNSIFGNIAQANAALAIDLTTDATLGVTLNDRAQGAIPDLDDGPNGLQNFPDLATAGKMNGAVTVFGDLYSTPSKSFTLDFYAVTACDPSGYGEADRYLGTASVATDAMGHAAVSASLPGAAATTALVAATATSATGDTSELSRCIAVGDSDLQVAFKASPPVVAVGNNINYDTSIVNAGPDPATGVVLELTLPPKVSFVVTVPQAACTQAGQVLSCPVGPIAANATAMFQVQTKVSSDPADIFFFLNAANRSLTASVVVHGDQHDPSLGSNMANGTTMVGTVGAGSGGKPLGGNVNPGDHDKPVNGFALNGATSGAHKPATPDPADATLSAVQVTASGTGNDKTDITAVKLYLDVNANGAIDPADTLLATTTYSADDGTATLTLASPVTVATGDKKAFIVAYDFAATIASAPPEPPPIWPVLLAGGLAALAVLLRPRRVRAFALGLGLLALPVCGGGGVDEDGPLLEDAAPSIDARATADARPLPDAMPTGRTYSAAVTGVTMTTILNPTAVTVGGLPIAGATLTIPK